MAESIEAEAQDTILVNEQTGNFDDLKVNAIDPSDTEDKPTDPRLGQPKFLSWTLKKDEINEEYWEAQGKDGKIYRIINDEPKPPKAGKVVVIDGGLSK